MSQITTAQLTEATIEGAGVFDTLMQTTKLHLEQEYSQNRIRGGEYSAVYLGTLTNVLNTSVQFLLQKEKADLEAEVLRKQALLIDAQITKTVSENLHTAAQIELVEQQKANLQDELLTASKERQKLEQEFLNLVIQGTVITAQECKLKAEFDLIVETKLKVNQETLLLAQKTATEKAQTSSVGVDDNSVIGKQKLLFAAQTAGYARDAEQKGAKALIDTWNIRRSTDDATVANSTNKLDDATIGAAVTVLLQGMGVN